MRILLSLLMILVLSTTVLAAPATTPSLESAIKAEPSATKELSQKFLQKTYDWMEKSGDAIGGTIQKGGEFVSEQAPLVCREIVVFGIAKGTLICGLGTVVMIVAAYIIKKNFKRIVNTNDYDASAGCAAVISVLAFIGGFIAFSASIVDLLKAIFAPRLYIMDQISVWIKAIS